LDRHLFSVAQAIVEPEFIALTVGFITCAQISGITIALAIANLVFLNKSQAAISAIFPHISIADIQAAITGAGSAFVANLRGGVKREEFTAIVDSMRNIYILIIVGGAITTVLSFVLKRERLLWLLVLVLEREVVEVI